MTSNDLRQKFLKFFESKGHKIIPSASLVPENDPSVLFTTAGMHPLVPYLLGEKHPGGKRVAGVQKCIRTVDIDDVGDNRHLTFFEMLGNWSFGDYFKKESIEWSFEFLTEKLGLDPKRIYVTVFKGEDGIPRDNEAIEIWKKVFEKAGIEAEIAGEDQMIKGDVRIIPLGVEDNFWIAAETGPCGGDTEFFYDMEPEKGPVEGKFSDLVDSFRLLEFWNNVFMEFNKKADGKYEGLKQKNVDTGMGLERMIAILDGQVNVFETEFFQPLFQKISEISGKDYEGNKKEFQIIADHIKAAVFIISDGITPSNVGRGYVLRRLIRRAIRHGKLIGVEKNFTNEIAETVTEMYGGVYKEVVTKKETISQELEKEENQFRKTLENGMKQFEKVEILAKNTTGLISGKDAFDLYQNYGFPFEMTQELAEEKDLKVDEEKFYEEFKKHQDLSRGASAGMFKGGLADSSEEVTGYHTATHLLLAALRQVLGDHVEQRGSNITAERMRFDFSHDEKMTHEEKKKVEGLVNEQIENKLPVTKEEMTVEEAKKSGAIGVFGEKYGEKVSVYTIVDPTPGVGSKGGQVFSREICGGPHVKNTGELGHFKIKKEESSSKGVRRIKAILEE